MKIIHLELILTHPPRKNAPSQVELFLIFYFKSVQYYLHLKKKKSNALFKNCNILMFFVWEIKMACIIINEGES